MAKKQWTVKDTNGNSIGIDADSKSQARRLYRSMIKGADIVEVTQKKVMRLALPGTGEKTFQPVPTIKSKNPSPGPNKPCKCGSGKKYKKCCMRKAPEKNG